MKIKLQFFVTLFLFTVTLNPGMAQVFPTFFMSLKNIQAHPVPNSADSVFTLGISDPFEYTASQFTIWYNTAIKPQAFILQYIKVSSELPSNLQPPTTQVDTNLGVLKISGIEN